MGLTAIIRNLTISTRHCIKLKRNGNVLVNKITTSQSCVSGLNVFGNRDLILTRVRLFSQNHKIPNPDQKQSDFKILKLVSGFLGACVLAAVGVGVGEVWVKQHGHEPAKKKERHGDYILPEFAFDVIDDIPSFEVREDDIWIMGFPKSGTTWLQEIVYLVATDADFDSAKSNIEDRVPLLEFMYPGIKVVQRMPSPRYIKTHLAFSVLPNDYKGIKPKTIYIARNPKDVLVSMYFYLSEFFLRTNVTLDSPFEEYCQLFVDGEVLYGPWWKHVREGWERRNQDNVLFITYEDMKMDPIGSIKKIATFLDKKLSDKDVQAIASHSSFEKMRHNQFVNKEWYKKYGMAKKDAYFLRKGEIGNWKQHLSQDTTAKLDEIVATKLGPLGLKFKDTADKADK